MKKVAGRRRPTRPSTTKVLTEAQKAERNRRKLIEGGVDLPDLVPVPEDLPPHRSKPTTLSTRVEDGVAAVAVTAVIRRRRVTSTRTRRVVTENVEDSASSVDEREKVSDDAEEFINLVDDKAGEETGIGAEERDSKVDGDGSVEEDDIVDDEEMANESGAEIEAPVDDRDTQDSGSYEVLEEGDGDDSGADSVTAGDGMDIAEEVDVRRQERFREYPRAVAATRPSIF